MLPPMFILQLKQTGFLKYLLPTNISQSTRTIYNSEKSNNVGITLVWKACINFTIQLQTWNLT